MAKKDEKAAPERQRDIIAAIHQTGLAFFYFPFRRLR